MEVTANWDQKQFSRRLSKSVSQHGVRFALYEPLGLHVSLQAYFCASSEILSAWYFFPTKTVLFHNRPAVGEKSRYFFTPKSRWEKIPVFFHNQNGINSQPKRYFSPTGDFSPTKTVFFTNQNQKTWCGPAGGFFHNHFGGRRDTDHGNGYEKIPLGR